MGKLAYPLLKIEVINIKKYKITGMSCASCVSRVEKAAQKVDGIKNINVNLLTNTLEADGYFDEKVLIKNIEDSGYKAIRINQDDYQKELENLQQSDIKIRIKKLSISIILTLVVFYLSLALILWQAPIFSFLKNNCYLIGILQFLLTTIVILINKNFFINGFKGIKKLSPNMDTLISLGSGISYLYSIYILIILIIEFFYNGNDLAYAYLPKLHFEASTMILTLISIGKLLEAISKGRTTNALKALLSISPKVANVIKDNKVIETLIDNVEVNDVIAVKPGEMIALDGVVIKGESTVDESAFTGESMPVDKMVDDSVIGSTLNLTGYLEIRVLKENKDSSLTKIIETVKEASSSKAQIARVADKVSQVFVPVVLGISLITFIIWLIISRDFAYALDFAISVMVISCPCSLGLATPVAIMVGSGVGAKNGILFKNANTIEELSRIKIIAFDKTKTITYGKPVVSDVIGINGFSTDELIKIASGLEIRSEHPIAYAITKYQEEKGIKPYEISSFKVHLGSGVSGVYQEVNYYAGSIKFMDKIINILPDIKTMLDDFASSGKTPIIIARKKEIIGIISVVDQIKEKASDLILELKNMGFYVAMITGDNEKTAQYIGDFLKIDKIIANTMPNDKAKIIDELKHYGKIAMVGDGINDSLALTTSDVGIAISGGTDVAMDSSSVVLLTNNIYDIAKAIKLSKKVMLNIKENLFWALIYNMVCIPLAAGALISIGLKMSPAISALCMSLSSVSVVLNALRLNLFKLKKVKRIKKTKISIDKNWKGIVNMTKKIKVDGMMCHHCEMHVEKALSKLNGVEMVKANYETGYVVVELSNDIDNDILKEIIEKEDYKVLSFE